MRMINRFMLLCFTLLLSSSLLMAANKEIQKSFAPVKKIKVKLILSSCKFITSEDGQINVLVTHNYEADDFEVSFKEKSSSILMKERFIDHDGDHHGDSHWQIALPAGVKVKFNSATGDIEIAVAQIDVDANTGTGEIEIHNSAGEFDMNTGTGDIDVKDSKGDFDLNTGTGEIEINNCSGNFGVNSGTGDVEGKKISIDDEADFNSGTGSATVIHPLGKNYDLSLNSGTDDAVLDMDGVELDGYFEFRANARRGDIDCPVDFDNEEGVRNGDGKYLQKSFTRGNSKTRFYISTGTGTAELKK